MSKSKSRTCSYRDKTHVRSNASQFNRHRQLNKRLTVLEQSETLKHEIWRLQVMLNKCQNEWRKRALKHKLEFAIDKLVMLGVVYRSRLR